MKRRDFLKTGASAALGLPLAARLALADGPQPEVHTVYIFAMCHLDMGFTDLEHDVIMTYFEDYIPKAIDTSKKLEEAGGEERLVWSLASWMVYEYLEQALPADRKIMDEAILDGRIAWHGYPLTWYSEMLDRSLMQSAFNISKALDKRFGVMTIAGKLTDVPGHTRSIIGPAVDAGIQFVDIGANWRPPDVPPDPHLFRWRDMDGAEITVLYHTLNYGGTAVLPGTGVAVAINIRNDNSGPYPIDEITKYYADLHKQFPNAKMVATNLNTIAKAVQQVKKERLPVVTQEIGDVWMYGTASGPRTVAHYRELSRLRLEWLEQKKFASGDPAEFAFMRKLILIPEHNWGLDTGAFPNSKKLVYYRDSNSPDELAEARAHNPVFQVCENSWAERRGDLALALSALPDSLRSEAQARLDALTPVAPDIRGYKLHDTSKPIETEHFIVALYAKTGAIIRLLDRRSGREWASAQHPLALFRYETFTGEECAQYVHQFTDDAKYEWPINVWGKPGLEKYPLLSRDWEPELVSASTMETAADMRITLNMRMITADETVKKMVGWPAKLTMEIVLPKSTAEVHITLCCFEKRANRLPESMWMTFSPDAPLQEGWQFEKINRAVSPIDVMSHGSRSLHAVTRRVGYKDDHGTFLLETLDAPHVAPGQRLLRDFNNRIPDMHEGVHVNLFNNLWNTAFPQWCDEDMRFRFVISFPQNANALQFA